MNYLLSIVGYSMFLLKLVGSKKHLLMVLLSLEGSMIIVSYEIMRLMGEGLVSMLGVLMFMVVMVSEGALGLGLLVSLVRGVGSDKFYFMNII